MSIDRQEELREWLESNGLPYDKVEGDMILALIKTEVIDMLNEVSKVSEDQKYVNREVHGRSDCKSCGLIERLDDKVLAIKQRYTEKG